MKMKLGTAAIAAVIAGIVGLSGHSAEAAVGKNCRLGPDGKITHVFYLQFDNVHLRRDNPNIPSDLEQMPHLLNFVTGNGTMLSNHHTPLISHTATDILTALTGNYGDKMGVPIANSFRYFNPDGTSNGASSFAYWSDPLAVFSASEPVSDTTPQMIDRRGKTHPAPWVPFTRAGCDVGAFSIANMELENIGIDITTVFGGNSPQAAEAASNSAKAQADFMGIAVHCALNSPRCAANSQPDVLNDEPGGYFGFQALFGNVSVQPQISPSGPIKDLDGNIIQDAHGNPGFPNVFNPTATQTLGYAATMFEAGVQVVYAYIADAHDNRSGSGTFGPGEAGYVAQLQAYDAAFQKFFARLAADGITPQNTLFVITADEGDHFVGGAPLPANCNGVTIPCTYAQKGEINADLSKVIVSEFNVQTPEFVHSDDVPTVYITGNPGPMASVTRLLEKTYSGLIGVNPITGNNDKLILRVADQQEQKILHMVTKDPKRTPTFVPFADANYFLSASGSTSPCSPNLAACFVEQPGFAWNHGDFQTEIVTTFVGMVGPGVQNLGTTDAVWSDHTDIRPTMMLLTDLRDSYAHDGRPLVEIIHGAHLPTAIESHTSLFLRLANSFKSINAPLQTLGQSTLSFSTKNVTASDTAYRAGVNRLAEVTSERNAIVNKMTALIEGAAFRNKPIDTDAAGDLISQANRLLAHLPQ